MPADADAPVFVFDGVVDADVTGVALRLHCVAAQGATGRRAVAAAHEDGVGGVAEMVCPGVLTSLRSARMPVVRREGKAQAGSGKSFTGSFESGDREAEG